MEFDHFIDSLHPQVSQEHYSDASSPVQETEPVEESSSTIVSDTEAIQIEVRHERQMLSYSPSFMCTIY